MSDLIEISGLWKNQSKDGKSYLTGYMGKARIVVFPNGFKKEDKHPDFIMYIGPPPEKNETDEFEDDVAF